jgi:hypothetical protein
VHGAGQDLKQSATLDAHVALDAEAGKPDDRRPWAIRLPWMVAKPLSNRGSACPGSVRTLKRRYGWECTRLDDVDVHEPGYIGSSPTNLIKIGALPSHYSTA